MTGRESCFASFDLQPFGAARVALIEHREAKPSCRPRRPLVRSWVDECRTAQKGDDGSPVQFGIGCHCDAPTSGNAANLDPRAFDILTWSGGLQLRDAVDRYEIAVAAPKCDH